MCGWKKGLFQDQFISDTVRHGYLANKKRTSLSIQRFFLFQIEHSNLFVSQLFISFYYVPDLFVCFSHMGWF